MADLVLPIPTSDERIPLVLRGVAESCTEAGRQHAFYRNGPTDLLWLNNAIDAAEAALDGAREVVRLLRAESKKQLRLRRLAKKEARRG